jgi:hypothetical protein
MTAMAFSTTPLPSSSSTSHQRRKRRTTTTTTTTTTAHFGSSSSNDYNNNNNNEDEMIRRQSSNSKWKNDARLDVRNLLTQRAIQSFLYLLESCRDPHSGKWIEEFLQTPGLLNYHGMGAAYIIDPRFTTTTRTTTTSGSSSSYSWVDGPLLSMLQQNKTEIIVSAKRRGRGHGGWSKQNPYLEDRYVEFTIDIDPIRLTNRILSVREQIAKEWIHDLNSISTTTTTTATNNTTTTTTTTTTQSLMKSYSNYYDYYHHHTEQQQQQQGTQQQGTQQQQEQQQVRLERTSLESILNNQTSFVQTGASSSPFRKGNLDLLYNLCTQASIHRLLQSMKDQVETNEKGNNNRSNQQQQQEQQQRTTTTYEWFRDFYSTRVATYFDGDLPYGRADDFVQALLQSSPSSSVVMTPSSSSSLSSLSSSSFMSGSGTNTTNMVGWIDHPLALVEQIIELRNIIVQEWKIIMEEVPHDHATGIRLAVLERQMMTWGGESGSGGSRSTSIGATDSRQWQ